MIRMCFNCRKELTVDEAADGQKALEEVVAAHPDFEGWVHCKSPPDLFVREDDEELKEAVENLGVKFFPDTIQICKECVWEAWKKEYE